MMIEAMEGRQLLSASLVGVIASGGTVPDGQVPTGVANLSGGQLISTLARTHRLTGETGVKAVPTLAKLKLVAVPTVPTTPAV